MPSHTPRHAAILIGFCLMVLACRSNPEEMEITAGNNSESAREESISLDLRNRTAVQPIGPGFVDPEKQKFLQFEITDVLNPKGIRIVFEVHYQLDNGERISLGSFSLFPAHNPANFIVATQGRLRNEGAIELSMVVLDQVGVNDEVQVKLKRISFSQE